MLLVSLTIQLKCCQSVGTLPVHDSLENDIVTELFIYALMLIYSDVIMCHHRHVITSSLNVELMPFFVIDTLCSVFVVSGNLDFYYKAKTSTDGVPDKSRSRVNDPTKNNAS